jgi:uncharacterized protein YbaR (Trm112 family)
MSAGAPRNQLFDTSILSQLACPVCTGELRLAQQQLVCGACGREYPIVDQIPVLIATQSAEPNQSVLSAISSISSPTRRTE